MIETTIESELTDCLNRMPTELQRRVLQYAKTLQSEQGTAGSSLLRFSGSIEASDLEAMEAAIHEGCEKIDLNEW